MEEEKKETTEEVDVVAEETETTEVEEKEEQEQEEQNLDLDDKAIEAELEKERKGKPDPEKAKKAFEERQAKREEKQEESEEKPLTRKDLLEVEEKVRSEMRKDRALELAKGMAGSDKEAELIVEKWKNRSFPEHLTLSEQIEEAFVITHRKKLMGERNEALRALKGKRMVNTDAASTHQEEKKPGEPKIPPQDAQAFKASGFVWNGTSRQYEKKLPNGDLLIRDSKTKETRLIKK